ncbi:PREDICTED: uncharacterized protein LOC105534530 [Mandrillus leucophaeus]|uniref:uncharacterized protein LOC105534530 n=1 Tax=Mandrillus leucophaeus TaxID=9568 RepID=UPI0005F39884|nr:PREDICTED: uncharacterized protein LOC105534530 [Mandrillus leucophaeus]
MGLCIILGDKCTQNKDQRLAGATHPLLAHAHRRIQHSCSPSRQRLVSPALPSGRSRTTPHVTGVSDSSLPKGLTAATGAPAQLCFSLLTPSLSCLPPLLRLWMTAGTPGTCHKYLSRFTSLSPVTSAVKKWLLSKSWERTRKIELRVESYVSLTFFFLDESEELFEMKESCHTVSEIEQDAKDKGLFIALRSFLRFHVQRALGPLGSAPHSGCSFTRRDGTGFNSRRPDSGRVAFPSPSTLSGRARGNSDPSLTAGGRAAETPDFPCTVNPGAAGLGLVA